MPLELIYNFKTTEIDKLSRYSIIKILKEKYNITSKDTSYITKNIFIIDKLLSRLIDYKNKGINNLDKDSIVNYYASMLKDYLNEYRDEGRELSIDYTDMIFVRRLLVKNNYAIPNKVEQQKIFTINALVKEIIN